jgi:uncharacterized protein (DUF302 family)
MQPTGLVTVRSAHSVAETINRLVSMVTSRGLLVFTRIDHALNAAQANLELRPTELVIFGSPTGGTPLCEISRQLALIYQ